MAYVYKHTRLDTKEVFYVGIGNDRSYKRAHQKISRNIFWKRVVNKTNYSVEIIIDNLNWKDACKIEIELIKKYGRRDLILGTLVNLTDGGEGMNNPSLDVREKMSKRMKGNTIMLGRKHTDETKEKMRISAGKKDKSCYTNPERNKKISKSKLGKHRSVETCEKMRKYWLGKTRIDLYGHKKAEEITNKIILKSTGKKRTEKFKKEQSIRFSGEKNPMFGKKHSDEFKEARREYLIKNNPGKNKSDETRKKISESKKGIPNKFKGIPREKIKCPHCDIIGGIGIMNRWHFNNCKNKK